MHDFPGSRGCAHGRVCAHGCCAGARRTRTSREVLRDLRRGPADRVLIVLARRFAHVWSGGLQAARAVGWVGVGLRGKIVEVLAAVREAASSKARFAGRMGRGERIIRISDELRAAMTIRSFARAVRCGRLAGWHATCCKKGASP